MLHPSENWHSALASTYKAPFGDSRDYATRKEANEDAGLVQRLPSDLSKRVPCISKHAWMRLGKDYYAVCCNRWAAFSAKAYAHLDAEIRRFCSGLEDGSESPWASASIKQWSDAEDLTKLLMETVFTLVRPFLDVVEAEALDPYRFWVTTRPDPRGPCQDAMVYIMREDRE